MFSHIILDLSREMFWAKCLIKVLMWTHTVAYVASFSAHNNGREWTWSAAVSNQCIGIMTVQFWATKQRSLTQINLPKHKTWPMRAYKVSCLMFWWSTVHACYQRDQSLHSVLLIYNPSHVPYILNTKLKLPIVSGATGYMDKWTKFTPSIVPILRKHISNEQYFI